MAKIRYFLTLQNKANSYRFEQANPVGIFSGPNEPIYQKQIHLNRFFFSLHSVFQYRPILQHLLKSCHLHYYCPVLCCGTWLCLISVCSSIQHAISTFIQSFSIIIYSQSFCRIWFNTICLRYLLDLEKYKYHLRTTISQFLEEQRREDWFLKCKRKYSNFRRRSASVVL